MTVIDCSGNVLHQHEGGSVYRSPRALRPQLGLGAVTRQPAAKTRVQQTGQRSTPSHSAQAAGVSTQSHQDHAGEMVICRHNRFNVKIYFNFSQNENVAKSIFDMLHIYVLML